MADSDATATQAGNGQSPWDAQQSGTGADEAFAERPEVYVGAALLGGIVLAKILKKLGGDD